MFEEKTSFLDEKKTSHLFIELFKLTWRKIRTCFSSKCCLKYVVKIWKENIENCSSYRACRFEKTCFEKNAVSFGTFRAGVFIAQVAVWETPDTPQEKREIKQTFFFASMKPFFASYSRRFKLNFKQKIPIFWKIYTGVTP